MRKQLVAGIAAGILFIGGMYGSAYAEVQHIEATGSYVIGDNENENIAEAKKKAKDAALRAAVEKAGVYVESYSKVKNMKLTDDEVRIISGQLLQIDNVEFHPVVGKDGVSITYICTVKATVDTDKIDLQEKLKQQKLTEENESQKQRIAELEAENKRLKEQYRSAQQAEQENLASLIKNNELALNSEIKAGYKEHTALLEIINAASKDIESVEGISVGTQLYALTGQILPYLADLGWKYKVTGDILGGNPYLISLQRTVSTSPNIIEYIYGQLENHTTVESINTYFQFPTSQLADDIFKLVYTNISTKYGMPTEGDITANSALWHNEKAKLRISTYKNRLYLQRNKNRERKIKVPAKLDSATRFLQRRAGTWYNSQGNVVLVITPDSINGCPVLGAYGRAGGGSGGTGYIRIQEDSGIRDLHLTDIGSFGTYQLLDDKIGLRKTKSVNYQESVDGVYLGCDVGKVKALLGAPDKVFMLYGNKVWRYNRFGMNIAFAGDLVERIKVEKGYPWKFDKSGFTSGDTLQALLDAYHVTLSSKGQDHFELGNWQKGDAGEYIWFNNFPNSLELNLWSN